MATGRHWAPNAAAALIILSQEGQSYDLVFSDIVMPGMNGLAFGRRIREFYGDLPVILTTGYSQALAQERSDGFELVQKPYSVDALAPVLQRALARRSNASR